MESREKSIYRSSSLLLREMEEDKLYECPTGLIMREASYLWKALATVTEVENGSISLQDQSLWLQKVADVASSEKERHRRNEREPGKINQDSNYGLRVRRGLR